MATRDKDTIKASIIQDVPDNNAGLVSAKDIRDNMVDTVESINQIVASGDTDSAFPFTGSSVRAAMKDGAHGTFIAESGITFNNAVGGNKTQIFAYEGPQGIDHSQLGSLGVDSHPQYLNVTGIAAGDYMEGGLGMNTNWIGTSGYDNRGLRFKRINDNRDDIHIGDSGNIMFDDGSRFDSSKGVAKAWINFDGSGTVGETASAATPGYQTPVVRSSYNISAITYVAQGQYKIHFTSGTLKDNNYIAVGNSNSISSSSPSATDFDVNTVGMTMREGDDLNTLRTLTFYVKSDDNEYVDANLNDLVVYGLGSGTTADSTPTINPS